MAEIHIGGRFEPNTVVELFETGDSKVLWPGAAHACVDRKRASEDGDVVFTGAQDDVRYIARGFDRDGLRQELRLTTNIAPEVVQRPIQRSPYTIGIHAAKPPAEPVGVASDIPQSQAADPSFNAPSGAQQEAPSATSTEE